MIWVMADVPLLPDFTGDPNNARDIIAYIVNPANAGLLDLDGKIDVITALVSGKSAPYQQESAPTSAKVGDLWKIPSTGLFKWCHTTYTEAEPSPSTQWESITDPEAQTALQTISQLASPTPQVSLLQQTLQGVVSDNSVSPSEKSTVKLVYDELVARKAEIDTAAIRYSLTGGANYTDYVASYTAWKAYIDTTANLFNDMGSATTINPSATWISVWDAVLSDEGAILTDIRTAAQDVLDTISGDLSTVQAQVDEMSADGTISPTEKLRFRDEWERVQDEYNELSAQATLYSLTGDTDWTNLNTAFTDLQTYLGAGSTNVFGDYSTATVLTNVGSNSTEWQQKWQAYWLNAKAFDAHVDEYFKGLIDTQQSSLDSILTDVSNLADDNIISGGTEKESLLARWNQIQRLHTNLQYQASIYSVTTPTAYTTAYNNLNNYLNTTISVFDNMSTDTAVVRSTFNSFFTAYETQFDLFSNSVADAQKVAVDADPASYATYTALIDSVVDDGIISAGMEKTQFNALWLDMQATHSIIKAKGDNVGINTAALQAAYDTLDSYIDTLTAPGGGSPNFTIENEDTAIGVSTWHSYVRAYEQAKDQMEKDVIDSILTLQQDAARQLLDINDDGIVSPPEKSTVFREFQRITSLKAQLETQADSLLIVTEKNNMTTAYNTLDTYLDSLDGGNGLFNDMGSATTLSVAEQGDWDTNWNNMYSTIAILETTIVSTIVGNTSAVGTASFKHDGSQPATGNFDLNNFKIRNLSETTPASGIKDAATVGQIYTEQLARAAGDSTAESNANSYTDGEVAAHSALTAGVHGVAGDVVGTTEDQTLTNKELTLPEIASLHPDPVTKAETLTFPVATDTLVGRATTDTLTNKTLGAGSSMGAGSSLDADVASLSNVDAADVKSSAKHTDFNTDPADGNTSFAMAEGVYDRLEEIAATVPSSAGPNHVDVITASDTDGDCTATTTTTNIGASATYLRATCTYSGGLVSGTVIFVKAAGGTSFVCIGQKHQSLDAGTTNGDSDNGTTSVSMTTNGSLTTVTVNRVSDSNVTFTVDDGANSNIEIHVLLEAWI